MIITRDQAIAALRELETAIAELCEREPEAASVRHTTTIITARAKAQRLIREYDNAEKA